MLTTTEKKHPAADGVDERPLAEVAKIMAASQVEAIQSIGCVGPEICEGAAAMARAISSGASLHYVAAGSSGLMAAADAMELRGTFSISEAQIKIHMAGGIPQSAAMIGSVEDDTTALKEALSDMDADDVVIAVSASGATPFVVEAVRIARAKGALVIGISNNENCALLENANVKILLQTPPEIIAGSTRLGAATAQKVTLNMLSTLMGIRLGHVHDGMMVNVLADNTKLRERAEAIVSTVAKVSMSTARDMLIETSFQVKPAILMAATGVDAEEAQKVLREQHGHLRPSLFQLTREFAGQS